jgi:hypothetical protein
MPVPAKNVPAMNDAGKQNLVLSHSRAVLVGSVVTQQGAAAQPSAAVTVCAAAQTAPSASGRLLLTGTQTTAAPFVGRNAIVFVKTWFSFKVTTETRC